MRESQKVILNNSTHQLSSLLKINQFIMEVFSMTPTEHLEEWLIQTVVFTRSHYKHRSYVELTLDSWIINEQTITSLAYRKFSFTSWEMVYEW